jgi:hypothetical protein|tara:strand:+ start:1494 stop:1766 length:273 start_codon:yes stop_codon:yes gene_type:complete
MKNTSKSRKSRNNKLTLKRYQNNRFIKAINMKAKRTSLFKFIPQKIKSGHPNLSKKRKKKRNKYISRNEVSPFRSIKERLTDYNSPLRIL